MMSLQDVWDGNKTLIDKELYRAGKIIKLKSAAIRAEIPRTPHFTE